ncbi:hypothetical protein [Nocardiopsis sp. NPDC006938]|uniref:hypothetical protein n=1 Tax=Nocardiopsis sp. NPDC006938 TaxID=3364337 RepID=UPI0036A7E368
MGKLLLDNGTPVRSAERIAEISVGLSRAAYDASRRVGSGNEKFRKKKYEEGLKHLNTWTESAGLGQAQVNTEMRDIVKRDTKLSPIFKETAHGVLARSESKTGEPTGPMNQLTLRPRMTPQQHYSAISKTLGQRFSSMNNAADFDQVLQDFDKATRIPSSPLRMGLRQDRIGEEIQEEIFRRSFKKAISESPPKLDMSPEFAALSRVRIMEFVERGGSPGGQEQDSLYRENPSMEISSKPFRKHAEGIFTEREVEGLKAYVSGLAKAGEVSHESSEEREFGF